MPRSKPHLSDPAASSSDGAGRSGFSQSMDLLEILGAVRAVVDADVRAASAPILLDGVPPLGSDESAALAVPASEASASGNSALPPAPKAPLTSPPPSTGLGSQLPPAIPEASGECFTPRPSEDKGASATIKESPESDHQVRKADQPPAERPPSRRRSRSEHAVREEDPMREKTLPQKRPRGSMSPATKRTFLQALSRTGNVRGSAYYAQISHEAAYQARRRDAAFACAWDGALVIARDMAQDELADKAMNGITEDIVYHGEVTASRTRFDGRLLLALLARLDKHAADNPAAMRGAARFDALLERIGAGQDADDLIATPTPAEEPWRYGEGGAAGAVGVADPALADWLAAQQEGG
ncbi:hypothetical protein ACR9YC_09480 [Parasphingorhabdus sp. DH2-15]|uniref:hypothetical protein n=1 Tax=Parasphingorhabdus sp. DH2-15 TaxID=3444112 RepID=UPI003F683FFD